MDVFGPAIAALADGAALSVTLSSGNTIGGNKVGAPVIDDPPAFCTVREYGGAEWQVSTADVVAVSY